MPAPTPAELAEADQSLASMDRNVDTLVRETAIRLQLGSDTTTEYAKVFTTIVNEIDYDTTVAILAAAVVRLASNGQEGGQS